MKKRFQKVLLKNGKKNGIFLLLCVTTFTISLGTLAGCSITKEGEGEVSDRLENDTFLPADNDILEDATMPMPSEPRKEMEKGDKMFLEVTREGETEEIPATLFVGQGYSIYLTDDRWQPHAPDAWTGVVDGQPVLDGKVQLWITFFKDKTFNQVQEELAEEGYQSDGSEIIRQESEMIYKVKLNEFEGDVWGVCYCYPIEVEEGWGAILPLIADTFVVTTENKGDSDSGLEANGISIESADIQEMKGIIEEFAKFYFGNDADALQKFLTSPYEGEIDTYEGTGTVSDFSIKGLPDVGEPNENDKWEILLEFRDSGEDSYTYLTFSFVKQESGWKIQSYGLEK
ncbi:MAG: hypothetical protein K2N90_06120 [Lachnospiraceae bacterium]|nr:hypothetical protein [Lachnospiraceae bacterium]